MDSLRAKPRSHGQPQKSQRPTPLTPTSTPTGSSSSATTQQGSMGQEGVGQLERADAGVRLLQTLQETSRGGVRMGMRSMSVLSSMAHSRRRNGWVDRHEVVM